MGIHVSFPISSVLPGIAQLKYWEDSTMTIIKVLNNRRRQTLGGSNHRRSRCLAPALPESCVVLDWHGSTVTVAVKLKIYIIVMEENKSEFRKVRFLSALMYIS